MIKLLLLLSVFSFFLGNSSVNGQRVVEPASVGYWLWVGSDPRAARKHFVFLDVVANSSFYSVMGKAAGQSSTYSFESTLTRYGNFVHTISGQKEDSNSNHYWFIYILDSDPNPLAPPPESSLAPVGVDDIQAENGHVYLFWYREYVPTTEPAIIKDA